MFKVQCYQGVGDTFYQRPTVRELIKKHGDVALATPFPGLHWDMPTLKFWYRPTMLRTQEKALLSVPKYKWAGIHKRAKHDLHIGYGHREFLDGLNIMQAYEKIVPLTEPFDMSFPLKDEWVETADKLIGDRKVCILREPTLRREYHNPSRNPKPGIMPYLVQKLREERYTVISIGDHETIEEWPAEKFQVDEKFVKGEFSVEQISAIIARAHLTLTAVGFAVPMSIAVNGKCFTVFGGHVKPDYIYDPRMNMTRHAYVAPEPFCNCLDMGHTCAKDIDHDFVWDKLRKFIAVE